MPSIIRLNMYRKEKSQHLIFSNRQIFFSSVGLSIIINLMFLVSVIYMSVRLKHPVYAEFGVAFVRIILQFICNTLLGYILFKIQFHIVKKNLSRTKGSVLIILWTLLTCGVLSPILSQIQWFLFGYLSYELGYDKFMAFNLMKDMILSILTLFVIVLHFTNYQREHTLLLNQKLTEENMRARYEALKNQLDPHFLFNSLNTLNGLIGMDDEKAHDYVDNLSSIFRYTLHSKTICKLSEELEFVDSYVNLLKIRYGENLAIHYDIAEKYCIWNIMPVSIQLLVENVIKHNIISNRKPLSIQIYTTNNDSVVVENRINRKLEEGTSGGLGLSNLSDRYLILFKKTITIKQNDGVFSVTIPLLNEQKQRREAKKEQEEVKRCRPVTCEKPVREKDEVAFDHVNSCL